MKNQKLSQSKKFDVYADEREKNREMAQMVWYDHDHMNKTVA